MQVNHTYHYIFEMYTLKALVSFEGSHCGVALRLKYVTFNEKI